MSLNPFTTYKICITCMSYNHAPYIKEALKGFAIQQTNFPFVALVYDDASTDGEQVVINDYINSNLDKSSRQVEETDDAIITIGIHKENTNCHFVFVLLKYNYFAAKRAKTPIVRDWYQGAPFRALCEGDDYWIDPTKLQRQVDFLEANPDYIMCCSDAKINAPTGELDWRRYDKDTEIPVKDIILGGGLFIQTCTICFRSELKRMPICCQKCHVGDYPLQIWFALNGKVYYFVDKMAIYNYGVPGSWTSRQSTESIEKSAKGWRSEVDMLQGLDTYSNGKYHDFFKQRITDYVYYLMHNHIDKWHTICALFDDVIIDFIFPHKIVEKLARWRYTKMATFVALMLEGEFKSAFVSLPLVNDVYLKWKDR